MPIPKQEVNCMDKTISFQRTAECPIRNGLRKFISERLAKKPFCTLFKQELSRVWPINEHEKEKRAITQFAKANGWSVKISDPGLRAVFRREVSA